MPDQLHEFFVVRVFECASDGLLLRTPQDAVDLIGLAAKHKASLFAIPIARLGDDFFRLETRVAGEFLQKFVTYGFGVAIVGNISGYFGDGRALKSFIAESNRGRHIWFVESLDELRSRIEAAS
ncbi:MAG TPA: DUF4180 domain-containing protein [Candidatus Aquilonibacter sp.]|nr:DUF4180 domain-containing protein [Candidatus Aquilonibacter sp.]